MRPKRFQRHRPRSPRRNFDNSIGNDLVNARDLVNTPDELAKQIVGHFRPQINGRVLEPCEGGEAFTRAFASNGIEDVIALEVTRGSDFFEFHEKVDWIITNPPWSQARMFLRHAYRVADNVVFLITLNHVLNLRARIADMEEAGFGIKEVLLCKTPSLPWPQSGFQLAAIHLSRGYNGQITWGWLDELQDRGSALSICPTAHILRASAFAIPLMDESVQTVVTSPSYFGLRRYAGGTENDLGREKSISLYVEHLVTAMREVRRVLRSDGVVFLIIADSYYGSGRGAGRSESAVQLSKSPHCDGNPLRGQGKAKSLCLIPHRVMIALENDGWIIRNDIIWEKANCVPESVKDRCTSSYEHVIVLVKSKKYCWNEAEAVEPSVCWEKGSLGGGHTPSRKDGKMKEFTMRHSNKLGSSKTEKRLSTGDVLMEDGTVKWHPVGQGPKGDALIEEGTHGRRSKLSPPIGNVKHQALGKPTLAGHRVEMRPTRNMRDVWHIPTKPHKENHIAMFPEQLVERCIRIGSRPGDVVADFFAGAGTTGLVARELKRNAVLMDISQEYCELMRQRLGQQEVLPPPPPPEEKQAPPPVLEGEPTNKALVESIVIRPTTAVINQEFVQWSQSYTGPKFHACLSDFPYGYHFMSSSWDAPRQATRNQVHKYLPSGQRVTTLEENIAFQQTVKSWGEAMLPHMFPGALVFVFAGTRMFEWVSTGMQMAGYEHWDTFCWLHAQGFPKARDISKQIDKKLGNNRTAIGEKRRGDIRPALEGKVGYLADPANRHNTKCFGYGVETITAPSKESEAWAGYKTPALKPSFEPILCFRAPRNGTYAELALQFGTGCLNVDGGRIGGKGAKMWETPKGGIWHHSIPGDQRMIDNPLGRYPANLILDEAAADMLGPDVARFFYCPKASKRERNAGCEALDDRIKPGQMRTANGDAEKGHSNFDKGFQDTTCKNDHPTVKPLALTRYLATLLLPPASVAPRRLLVPFAGSGSEVIGGVQAGWDEIVGIEQDAGYCEIAEARVAHHRQALGLGTHSDIEIGQSGEPNPAGTVGSTVGDENPIVIQ